jgi:hypothetical protein
MAISLELLTKIASGKITPEEATEMLLLPAMRKAGTPTLILKIKPREGEFNMHNFNTNEFKDSEFKIIQEYWKEDFDQRMNLIKTGMRDLSEIHNDYSSENDELKLKYEALEKEHRKLIGMYNKNVFLKPKK